MMRTCVACVIGALAVHLWGEPRATSDVDFSALAQFGDEGRVIDVLLRQFEPRRPHAKGFALANRVLLVRTQGGVDEVARREKAKGRDD
jgi:hypothetical protein